MGKIIKKHSGFLYWVLVPSLLLVISVFGVNLVSRPSVGGASLPQCTVVADCTNNDPNPCRQFQCTNSQCVPLALDRSNPSCIACGTCGNGICDAASGEFNSCSGPGQDCDVIYTGDNECDTGTACKASSPDFCCPPDCTGNPADGTSFDIDCACCGDTFPTSLTGEECDPAGSACFIPGITAVQSGICTSQCQCTGCGDGQINSVAGEQCDPQFTAQPNGGCPTGETCNPTSCVCTGCGDGVIIAPEQCDPPDGTTCDANCQNIPRCGDGNIDPGEECDPPNTATCDANCQLLPVCGNGIVETGEQCDGTTCSVTNPADGTIIPGICQACQCIPQCELEGSGCGDNANTSVPCVAGTGGTTTGVASLVPVHPTVLVQWIATFVVPGAVFTGLRMRRKSKK